MAKIKTPPPEWHQHHLKWEKVLDPIFARLSAAHAARTPDLTEDQANAWVTSTLAEGYKAFLALMELEGGGLAQGEPIASVVARIPPAMSIELAELSGLEVPMEDVKSLSAYYGATMLLGFEIKAREQDQN